MGEEIIEIAWLTIWLIMFSALMYGLYLHPPQISSCSEPGLKIICLED